MIKFVLFIETSGKSKSISSGKKSQLPQILGMEVKQERYTATRQTIDFHHQLLPTGKLELAVGTAQRIDIGHDFIFRILEIEVHRIFSLDGKDGMGWEKKIFFIFTSFL